MKKANQQYNKGWFQIDTAINNWKLQGHQVLHQTKLKLAFVLKMQLADIVFSKMQIKNSNEEKN